MAQGQRRGLRLISSSQWNIREEPHGIRKTIEVYLCLNQIGLVV